MFEYNLSVIVPLYNCEKYIKNCLESIAAQTLNKIEVIVIDDGSTDESSDIARSFEESFTNFNIVSQSNSGRSAARNRGLDIASGKYIAFVDADDFIDPVMYELLFRTASEQNSEEVRCGSVEFESESGKLIKFRNEFEVYTEITSTENIFKAYLEKKIDRVVWNGIYHRSLFEKVRFPLGKVYEDQYVTPEILAKTNKYIYIPNYLYYYRKHSEAFSSTESSTPLTMADKAQSLNLLYQIIDESGMKKELSQLYSIYFHNMIINYHNSIVFNKPENLRKSRRSIADIIIPEAFEFVLNNDQLSRQERSFIKLMHISHFLFLPIHLFYRVLYKIFNTSNKDIHNTSNVAPKEIIHSHNNSIHKKLIRKYA